MLEPHIGLFIVNIMTDPELEKQFPHYVQAAKEIMIKEEEELEAMANRYLLKVKGCGYA